MASTHLVGKKEDTSLIVFCAPAVTPFSGPALHKTIGLRFIPCLHIYWRRSNPALRASRVNQCNSIRGPQGGGGDKPQRLAPTWRPAPQAKRPPRRQGRQFLPMVQLPWPQTQPIVPRKQKGTVHSVRGCAHIHMLGQRTKGLLTWRKPPNPQNSRKPVSSKHECNHKSYTMSSNQFHRATLAGEPATRYRL